MDGICEGSHLLEVMDEMRRAILPSLRRTPTFTHMNRFSEYRSDFFFTLTCLKRTQFNSAGAAVVLLVRTCAVSITPLRHMIASIFVVFAYICTFRECTSSLIFFDVVIVWFLYFLSLLNLAVEVLITCWIITWS